MLIGDPEPQVRAATAASLMIRAARGDDEALQHAETMLDDEGSLVSLALANILSEEPALLESGRFDALVNNSSG